MRTIPIRLHGKKYHMAFNYAAKVQIQDTFDTDDVFSLLGTDEGGEMSRAEQFERLCKVASILATQGELVRRYEGYDNGHFLDADALMALAGPMDEAAIRYAAMQAVVAGYGGEIKDDEIDLGLAELNKKKDSVPRSPNTFE